MEGGARYLPSVPVKVARSPVPARVETSMNAATFQTSSCHVSLPRPDVHSYQVTAPRSELLLPEPTVALCYNRFSLGLLTVEPHALGWVASCESPTSHLFSTTYIELSYNVDTVVLMSPLADSLRNVVLLYTENCPIPPCRCSFSMIAAVCPSQPHLSIC